MYRTWVPNSNDGVHNRMKNACICDSAVHVKSIFLVPRPLLRDGGTRHPGVGCGEGSLCAVLSRIGGLGGRNHHRVGRFIYSPPVRCGIHPGGYVRAPGDNHRASPSGRETFFVATSRRDLSLVRGTTDTMWSIYTISTF